MKVFALVGACIASWITYLYKHDYIATDERGLTHRTPFGQRFIAWDDVTRFGKNDWGFFFIFGENARLCFFGGIVRQQELLDEIARRASNSQTREWHHI